ncbi:molybdate ABC transporter substrate-binding protein [Xylanimonas protaetiae]|uniref:Molybdate ABC transporter substrate-binding protein n=1 Tax=Xylanimonas protaetiae TaxID=2509457 RepID=A0A4P6F1U1_9MICO|nr:molybdate ABC transporter substrate-binding protein [Xylanimonas protaetiae]QAY69105.1 molybdate ABC transporter substrate-binding protein [Xylanimonas protaetiae]
MSRRVAVVVATTALVALSTAGCAHADAEADSPATLTVFAAASLKDVFTQLGASFEADHPGVTVAFSFAGSSDLVAQLQQGAPADVFASADTANMDKVVADSLVAAPVDFATNTLTIAVPPGNPAKIASFADLTADGVQLVVCAPQVPCGRATTKVEESTGLDLHPVSEEQSVTDVLTKVIAGEADAGLVYVTDVQGAGDRVTGVPFPESASAVNTYPIAVLDDAAEPTLARQFVDLVTSPAGQQALAEAGFGAP